MHTYKLVEICAGYVYFTIFYHFILFYDSNLIEAYYDYVETFLCTGAKDYPQKLGCVHVF